METKRFDLSSSKYSVPKPHSESLLHQPEQSADKKDSGCSFGRFQNSTSLTPKAVLSPLHYEPGYAYPLMIWLHGPGDDERQLRTVMQHVSLRNYVAVAPRGTRSMPEGKPGYTWEQAERDIFETADSIFECLDFVYDRFNIAPNRIFIGGFQSGGTMALRQAFINPGVFAGVLSIGAGFPKNHQPLGQVNRIRNLPIFLGYGTDSEKYTQEELLNDWRLAHAANLSLGIHQYPEADDLTTTMLQDADRWMMNIVCAPPAPVNASKTNPM